MPVLAALGCGAPAPEAAAPCQETPWFFDGDGDGHGDPGAAPVDACDAPAGHVAAADDCDDGDAAVHPGAPEACDGRNTACDPAWTSDPAVRIGDDAYPDLAAALAAAPAQAEIRLCGGEHEGPWRATASVSVIGEGPTPASLTAATGEAILTFSGPTAILRGVSVGRGRGVGVVCDGCQSLTIEDATFTENGLGAVRVDGADAETVLRRAVFVDNGADGSHAFGAVWAAGASLRVEDCAFTGNRAGDSRSGGAILSAAADTVVARSAFTGNSAGSWTFFGQGGAGGAIAWGASGPGTLRIEDATFSGNDASFGGAVAVWRGDLDTADTVATISGSTFAGNTASDAGAHLWLGSAGELTATGGALSAADAEAGGIVAVGAGTLRLSGSAVDGDSAAAVVDPWSDAPAAWFPVPGAADVDLCLDGDGPC